jgi:tetraprenyl-beta-curcumene synthase
VGATREIAAAVSALAAYLTTALPAVRRELRRWRRLVEAIPDPERRRWALDALAGKASNVEAVAVFATLAPRRRRRAVLRAIVPLQVGIDYLDTLEEAGADPAGDPYLAALHAAWVREAEALPACQAVVSLLRGAVDRCSAGQRHTHAAAGGASAQLRQWAEGLGAPAGYRWWEVAAGASSSVAAHALIAAAADPETTAETAARIDAAYNPSVGALTVLLDDLVDRERDRAAGEHNYIGYYGGPEAADRLAAIAAEAGKRIGGLPRAGRHEAIRAGVVAFYLSALEGGAFERPIRQRLLEAAGPGARLLSSFTSVRRLREPGRSG